MHCQCSALSATVLLFFLCFELIAAMQSACVAKCGGKSVQPLRISRKVQRAMLKDWCCVCCYLSHHHAEVHSHFGMKAHGRKCSLWRSNIEVDEVDAPSKKKKRNHRTAHQAVVEVEFHATK